MTKFLWYIFVSPFVRLWNAPRTVIDEYHRLRDLEDEMDRRLLERFRENPAPNGSWKARSDALIANQITRRFERKGIKV